MVRSSLDLNYSTIPSLRISLLDKGQFLRVFVTRFHHGSYVILITLLEGLV